MSGYIRSKLESWAEDLAEQQLEQTIESQADNYLHEHFQPTKNPYFEVKKTNGKSSGSKEYVRRELPRSFMSKAERRAWRRVQNRAWSHDRNLFASCCCSCFGADFCWFELVGWGPLVVLVPLLGPGLMYWVHSRLIKFATREFDLPVDLQMEMYGNIMFNLLVSLVPVMGSIFSWLYGCSTRNAAMVYNYVCERHSKSRLAMQREVQRERERLFYG